MHSSSTGLLALLGYWFLTLPATSTRFLLFELMNDYSMYPYIPTGAVSLSGPHLRLFDPLTTPTTDNHIPKDSSVDIKHPVLPDIDPFSSDFALDQMNPRHWPLNFSWVSTNDENFSDVFIFLRADVTIAKFQTRHPLTHYLLVVCIWSLQLFLWLTTLAVSLMLIRSFLILCLAVSLMLILSFLILCLAVSLMLIRSFLIPCLLLRSSTRLYRPTSPLANCLQHHS